MDEEREGWMESGILPYVQNKIIKNTNFDFMKKIVKIDIALS